MVLKYILTIFKQINERYSILFYAMYPWLKILISFTTFKSFLSLTIMQLINYALHKDTSNYHIIYLSHL